MTWLSIFAFAFLGFGLRCLAVPSATVIIRRRR